jgi:hypothetical protein
METASWDAAIASFAQTLQALQREEPGSSREQRQAFAAQYLAAVMLLKAAGAGAGTKEAKLYRWVVVVVGIFGHFAPQMYSCLCLCSIVTCTSVGQVFCCTFGVGCIGREQQQAFAAQYLVAA